MKIISIKLLPLHIPFLSVFSHASKTREFSDTFLIRIQSSSGSFGFGEALVRPYVTGESIAMFGDILRDIASDLGAINWKIDKGEDSLHGLGSLMRSLDEILEPHEFKKLPGVIAYNGLQCALELAILDGLLQEEKLSLSALLKPIQKEVLYSGIISGGTHDKAFKTAQHLKQFGLRDFKLKITKEAPSELVKNIRSLIGEGSTLRVDANSAFTVVEAIELAKSLEPFSIRAIEQPILRGNPEDLAKVQRATSISIMADEALITKSDAEDLIKANAVKMFNVRLAKCGGIAKSLELINLAKTHGIEFQLGCLVGETSILSAVGRHFSASSSFAFTEGSFGTLLLKKDIANPSIRFGFGGKGSLLRGLSFGIHLNRDAIDEFLLDQDVKEFVCLG